ncbi:MAG: shikimate kinase [Phycisphaerales bacterium]|jgi:shikimate kinase|nr:shikimate kinase [Phycisphaerales bacterium]
MNLALIGLRGSGKSTLARRAAEALSLTPIDLDNVTPALMGHASVREAWEREGEPAFRDAESQALRGVLAQDNQSIALGGGTPTAPGARDMLERARRTRRAIVVYLRAAPDTLAARLSASDNAHRPSLTGKGTIEEIAGVLAARGPLYESLADSIIDVDTLDEDGALRAILDAWRTANDQAQRDERTGASDQPSN